MNDEYIYNLQPVDPPISVLYLSGKCLISTNTSNLNISLSSNAIRVHVFKILASGSPVSIDQLCDAGCEAQFSQHYVKIAYNNKII